MSWYIKVIANYATFKGRARRKEYWMFFLINMSISFGLGFFLALAKGPTIFGNLYALFMLLPGIAVGVRRMHDTNHSGWWGLCPLYNFVLACMPGDTQPNRFGPDPKSARPNPPVRQAA